MLAISQHTIVWTAHLLLSHWLLFSFLPSPLHFPPLLSPLSPPSPAVAQWPGLSAVSAVTLEIWKRSSSCTPWQDDYPFHHNCEVLTWADSSPLKELHGAAVRRGESQRQKEKEAIWQKGCEDSTEEQMFQYIDLCTGWLCSFEILKCLGLKVNTSISRSLEHLFHPKRARKSGLFSAATA